MTSDERSIIEIIGYLNTGFHALVALAFIVVCLVNAKRVGMAGAILLAVIAVVDVGQVCCFRVGMIGMRASASVTSADTFFTAMGVLNVLSNLAAIGLVFAAMAMLRRPPPAT